MNLILDFGNTQKKLALFDAGELLQVEQYPEISRDLIERFLACHPGINACILSSVIRHPEDIESFLRQKMFFLNLDEHTPIPLINRYESPESLGKDRLAAAVAGSARFPDQDVLVINAGTALTFDFTNSRREYSGGAISPGMQMRFNALHTFTDKLPLLSYEEPAGLTGNSTRQSVLSGVINGMAAEIEGIAKEYQKQFPGLKVILSGGDLNYFVKRLKISIFALPNIVIHGLQQILTFNVNQAP